MATELTLRSRPTAHGPRATAYCLLPAARCLLPSARCLLPIAGFLLAGLLLLFGTGSARAEAPEAWPVEGEPFPAELAAVDSDWQVTFRVGQQRRVVPAADLVLWGSCREVRRTPLLLLADGSLLAAEVFAADKDRLTADSDLFGLVRLPLDLLAGVVFHRPAERHAADLLLDRVAAASGASDVAILTNGDEVAGRLEAIQDDTIRLETVVGPVDIEVHRVRALVFDPALLRRVGHQGLHAIAGFSDGSRLIADRVLVGGDSLQIEVAGGVKWTAAPRELVCLQPLGGRVAYLSDLKAGDYQHFPFLEMPWPYRTDRNVTGGLLRSGGRLYLKGLGMHSAAQLTYPLTEPYRRFQAEVAIDDSTAGRGSVRFRVFVDGDQKYVSETIRGGMPPVPLSVDLDGAGRLDLVVDFADRADELDHANWLNARVVK